MVVKYMDEITNDYLGGLCIENLDGFSMVSALDEELVELTQKGDEIAIEFLLKKYMYLIRLVCENYFNQNNKKDIIQEGIIGFLKALKGYKSNRGASFATFARIIIKYQMIILTRKETNRHKKFKIVPFFLENIIDKSSLSPEEIFIRCEDCKTKKEILKKIKFSNLEVQVLKGFLKGMSYREIFMSIIESKRPDEFSKKYIDNALNRIKNKIKKYENI